MMCITPEELFTYNKKQYVMHPPGFQTPQYYNHVQNYKQHYKYNMEDNFYDMFSGYLPHKKRPSVFCANCGGFGHVYKTCNHPIISYGVICYKNFYDKDTNSIYPKYLMVQRKDSLCYVEFIRGKYSLSNKEYLMKLFSNMTEEERTKIATGTFESLWNCMWCRSNKPENATMGNPDTPVFTSTNEHRDHHQCEKHENSRNFTKEWRDAAAKFDMLKKGYYIEVADRQHHFFNLDYIVKNTHSIFNETEWGFPKGRRNINEEDMACAIREFKEETGLPSKNFRITKDIKPLEEVFTGTNNVRYKHVYYVAKYNQHKSDGHKGSPCELYDPCNATQNKEVRDVQWFTYQEAQDKIRDTNVERKELFKRLNQIIIKSYQYM